MYQGPNFPPPNGAMPGPPNYVVPTPEQVNFYYQQYQQMSTAQYYQQAYLQQQMMRGKGTRTPDLLTQKETRRKQKLELARQINPTSIPTRQEQQVIEIPTQRQAPLFDEQNPPGAFNIVGRGNLPSIFFQTEVTGTE